MKAERYTIRALKSSIKQIFEALTAIHKKGFIHRDIKSKNFLVELGPRHLNLKLADFGLVKQINDRDQVIHTVCGTPGYMAPEMIKEEGYDSKCDVFSAGCVAYQILTRSSLFKAPDVQTMLRTNSECNLEPIDGNLTLSMSDKAFLRAVLNPDPEQRLTAQVAVND